MQCVKVFFLDYPLPLVVRHVSLKTKHFKIVAFNACCEWNMRIVKMGNDPCSYIVSVILDACYNKSLKGMTFFIEYTNNIHVSTCHGKLDGVLCDLDIVEKEEFEAFKCPEECTVIK